MSIDTVFGDIEPIFEEAEKLKKQMQDMLKAKFNEVVESIFKNDPTIRFITWEQHTPYFNDGEECVFGLGEVYVVTDEFYDNSTKKEQEELFDTIRRECYLEDWTYSPKYNPDAKGIYGGYFYGGLNDLPATAKKYIALARKFKALINQMDETMKTIFGDHVIVVLRPDGDVTVFEYENHG